jgi:acetyl esterase/lipase
MPSAKAAWGAFLEGYCMNIKWRDDSNFRLPQRAFATRAIWVRRRAVCAALTIAAILVIRGIHAALAADVPGSLISTTPMPGAPGGASAYRIVYTSTGLSGEPVPVSGVVVVPGGPEPPGGRPIVAWAHPTTGVVNRCAPSLARVFFSSVQGLNAMLARGYIVAATDYPGLGTPEVHPYLVGISEGRAVLDSVRAAQQIPGVDAGQAFAVWGHSQGGHAALYAGLLAPATDLATLMTDDLGTGGGNNITAMTLWSWSRIYGVSITPLVRPGALPVIDQLANECIERWFDMFIRRGPTSALEKQFLAVHDLATVEPWRGLLAQNSPGALPPDIPVFIAQGTADLLVRPSVTAAFVDALCRAGSRVKVDLLQGVGHAFIARDVATDAVAWIAARFEKKSVPNDCSR